MSRIPTLVGYMIFVATLAAQPSVGGDCGATHLLDVSKFAGAGEQYAKPSVEGACEGDEFIIRSNGIPHYEFVQITPNPLTGRRTKFVSRVTPRSLRSPLRSRFSERLALPSMESFSTVPTRARSLRSSDLATRYSTPLWTSAWATPPISITITRSTNFV